MTIGRLLAVAGLMTATASTASSDAAWAALDAKVAERCTAASGLQSARAARPIGFDDTLGKMVTLVSGTFRPRRGAPLVVRTLCVFDQKSGKVWLAEAPGWSAPPR